MQTVCGKLDEKTDLRSQRICSRFIAATMSNILTGDFIVRGHKAMCGRYYISQEDEADAIRKILEILEPKLPPEQKLKTHGEVFPTDLVPVLANNRALQQTPFAMRWGYRLDNRNLINARSETAAEKPIFKDGMLQHRCLVLASWYFEWQTLENKTRTKFAIRTMGSELIYMAGIYRIHNAVSEMVILTREASEDVALIHNRMPVILPPDARNDWFNLKYDGNDVLRAAETHMELTQCDDLAI